MTSQNPLSTETEFIEAEFIETGSDDSCRESCGTLPECCTHRSEAETPLMLQAQRRKLQELGAALRKRLRQPLALPNRHPRDLRRRDRQSNRRMIGRLYFGWFGGVQLFYSRENEP